MLLTCGRVIAERCVTRIAGQGIKMGMTLSVALQRCRDNRVGPQEERCPQAGHKVYCRGN